MGEIKSTLDLVLERTRHLSLSPEERAQQQRDELEKRLQGLLQQYEDGAFAVDVLVKRIGALQAELNVDDAHLVIAGIAKRLDPDQDNQARLTLLSTLAPALASPIATALAAHRERQAGIRQEGEARARAYLVQTHEIQGSAVIANPEKDPQCLAALAGLRQETAAQIAAIAQPAA